MKKDEQVYIGLLKKLERKIDRLEILMVMLLNRDSDITYEVSENNTIHHPRKRDKPDKMKSNKELTLFNYDEKLPF